MAGINKQLNSYAEFLGGLYDTIPKAVFAAIAVSMVTNGGDQLDEAAQRLIAEWRILYDNHIVPQKPPRCDDNEEPS